MTLHPSAKRIDAELRAAFDRRAAAPAPEHLVRLVHALWSQDPVRAKSA